MHRPVLVTLVAIDLAFAVLFVIGHQFGFHEVVLGGDTTWAERFNFFKWTVGAAIGAAAFVRWRNPLFLALGACALILLIDDSQQVHERGATFLLETLGLRGMDIAGDRTLAEAAVFAMTGVVCAILVLLSLRSARRDTPRPARVILRDIVVTVAFLAFFGIFVDGVHAGVEKFIPLYEAPFALVEELGEMLGISALVACMAYYLLVPRDD